MKGFYTNINKKRWIVLSASLLINLCIGSGYAWSVFSGSLTKEFGWTAQAISIAFTIANGISPIPMMFGGKIQDKYGPKGVVLVGSIFYAGGLFLSGLVSSLLGLYIAYGVGLGIGMGLIYICTISSTVKFFPDMKGLIAGLSTAGYGMATVIAAPIAQKLIDSTGVLSTFKIFGITYFIIIVVCAMFLEKPPEESKQTITNNTAKNKTWKEMIKTPLFYILLCILTIGATSGLMIISQASAMAQEIVGVNASKAAMGVSLIAIANAAGRILWGMISDKVGRYNTLPIMFIILIIMMFWLTTAGAGQWIKFIISVMFIAFCFGGFMGVFPAITSDSFGPKHSGINYAWMFWGFAIGGFIGPKVAVTFKHFTDTPFAGGFMVAMIMAFVGGCLAIYAIHIYNADLKRAGQVDCSKA